MQLTRCGPLHFLIKQELAQLCAESIECVYINARSAFRVLLRAGRRAYAEDSANLSIQLIFTLRSTSVPISWNATRLTLFCSASMAEVVLGSRT
jgi:hypothetical protein